MDLGIRLIEGYDRPLLVPMTLVDPRYLQEIHGGLRTAGTEVHHFCLRVPVAVLMARIDAQSFTPDDPERDIAVRSWRKEQIARCEAAVAGLPGDTVLLDGELPTAVLAARVLDQVKGGAAALT